MDVWVRSIGKCCLVKGDCGAVKGLHVKGRMLKKKNKKKNSYADFKKMHNVRVVN